MLHARDLTGPVAEATELLALVAGQDVEEGTDGTFRIARKVARDRVLSTVDPPGPARPQVPSRTFDGYKTHLAADPDDELITNAAVTPANTPDRDAIDDLLDEPAELRGDSAFEGHPHDHPREGR